MEPREGAEGNASEHRTRRTQSRESVSQGLERVRKRARQEKKERFTALLHHVDVDLLRTAFFALKRDAAAGVDGVTWRGLRGRTWSQARGSACDASTAGAYRAQPPAARSSRKRMDGSGRSAIAALEDKIVQRAAVEVLNAIYEEDFLGFSYGFRPGRGPA